MRGTEELRRGLVRYLAGAGVEAVAAWPGEHRSQAGQAVAAVSLRACSVGPPGFQDYLGERYDEAAGRWEELYGKKVRLTFGLDLYAATAAQVQEGLDALTAALARGGPEGLRPVAFSAGETVWRKEAGRYFCPVQAEFEAWSYAVTGEDGAFLDFTVRGESRG